MCRSGSGRGELRGSQNGFYFIFLFFFKSGGVSNLATVPPPTPTPRPVVRGSGCQGGARIQNPVVFLLFMAESPLCLVSDRLAAGCCGASVLMNEVCAARTLGVWQQQRQDAALSPGYPAGQTVSETT